MEIIKNEIMLGDCMDLLAELPDKSIDLAIVDPPYGLGIDGQKENKKNKKSDRKFHVKKNWDKNTPCIIYFEELSRVSKNQIIFGGNYFVDYLKESHKGWIVWDKGQRGLTMSDCEIAYSSFDCPTRIITYNRVELLKDKTIHPTQKPLKLYREILLNYAKPDQIILDTHSGSGSLACACHLEKYDFIAIEKDPEYHALSVKRLEELRSQGVLF